MDSKPKSSPDHPLDRDLMAIQNTESRYLPPITESACTPSPATKRDASMDDHAIDQMAEADGLSSRNIMTVSQRKSKTSTQLQKFEEEKLPSFESGR